MEGGVKGFRVSEIKTKSKKKMFFFFFLGGGGGGMQEGMEGYRVNDFFFQRIQI